jgi:hypothetical protein
MHEPRSEPGPSLRVSLAIVATAVVVGAACAIPVVERFLPVLFSQAYAVPATITLQASDAAEYAVFERAPAGLDILSGPGRRVTPEDVVVTGPDGARLATAIGATGENLARNNAAYVGSVTFTTPTPGRYTVQIRSAGTTVLVGESFSGALAASMPWVVGIPIAIVLLVIGAALTIIGLVRRSRYTASSG